MSHIWDMDVLDVTETGPYPAGRSVQQQGKTCGGVMAENYWARFSSAGVRRRRFVALGGVAVAGTAGLALVGCSSSSSTSSKNPTTTSGGAGAASAATT